LQPVKNQGRLVRYIKEIGSALKYIHSCGVIHGDLKLANVFAHREEGSEFQLKLADFGLSLIIEKDTGKAYRDLAAGTLGYLAPEVKDNSYVTTAVDIWSFGIMVYEMCVAYKPTDWGGYKYGKRVD